MSILYQRQKHIELVKWPEVDLRVKLDFPFQGAILRQQTLYRQQVRLGIGILVGIVIFLLINFVGISKGVIVYEQSSPRLIHKGMSTEAGKQATLSSPLRFTPQPSPADSLIIGEIGHSQLTPLYRVERANSILPSTPLQPRRIYRLASLANITPQDVLRDQAKTGAGDSSPLSKPLSSLTLLNEQDSQLQIYLDGLDNVELQGVRPSPRVDKESQLLASKLKKRKIIAALKGFQVSF